MSKMGTVILATIIMVLLSSSYFYGGEKAPQKAYDLSRELAKYGKDPIIVKAVKAQNAKGMSLDQIKEKDDEWKKTPGIVDFMRALMDSESGKYLRKILNSKPYFSEIFVMDKHGANVAMSDKTSDYWQGDEAKFQKSFNNGKGAIFVDNVEFDESTQAYLVQISVPVKDGNNAIGAITFGINADKL